jgi:2-methylisocitrate lyase-like PEP mutase family enzyme
MAASEQINKAEAFRAMHTHGSILVLANVWDVASARVVEDAGFPALATTSAGIAFAHGFPDGQKIPPEQMFAAIAEIAARVRVPVSADVEAGYGPKPSDAARTARAVIEAGAVGMNFEDATGEPERPLFDLSLQVERIRAIRESSQAQEVPLVLNARTDVYLAQVGDPATRYDRTVKRLTAFRDAGADCVFVPGVRDSETIRRIVVDLQCPVNILAGPGSPTIPELAALAVRRVSLGSGPMRATMGLLQKLARELSVGGTYSALDKAPSHAQMNDLMKPSAKN